MSTESARESVCIAHRLRTSLSEPSRRVQSDSRLALSTLQRKSIPLLQPSRFSLRQNKQQHNIPSQGIVLPDNPRVMIKAPPSEVIRRVRNTNRKRYQDNGRKRKENLLCHTDGTRGCQAYRDDHSRRLRSQDRAGSPKRYTV